MTLTPEEIAAAVERFQRTGEWPTDERLADAVRRELDDDARAPVLEGRA